MNDAMVPSNKRRSSFLTTRFSHAFALWYESTQYPNKLEEYKKKAKEERECVMSVSERAACVPTSCADFATGSTK